MRCGECKCDGESREGSKIFLRINRRVKTQIHSTLKVRTEVKSLNSTGQLVHLEEKDQLFALNRNLKQKHLPMANRNSREVALERASNTSCVTEVIQGDPRMRGQRFEAI